MAETTYKMKPISLAGLKIEINDIRQAIEICRYVKNLYMIPSYECSKRKGRVKYCMHITWNSTTELSNGTKTVANTEKNVIVAQWFRNTDKLIIFDARINTDSALLKPKSYRTEYLGFAAFLIYRRLKKEYNKQQLEQQK